MTPTLQSLFQRLQGSPFDRRRRSPGRHLAKERSASAAMAVLDRSDSPKEGTMSSPVVLITGALTGIGRAVALAFAREGNRVVVSGRHDDAGAALVRELRELGTDAEFVRADIRHE